MCTTNINVVTKIFIHKNLSYESWLTRKFSDLHVRCISIMILYRRNVLLDVCTCVNFTCFYGSNTLVGVPTEPLGRFPIHIQCTHVHAVKDMPGELPWQPAQPSSAQTCNQELLKSAINLLHVRKFQA